MGEKPVGEKSLGEKYMGEKSMGEKSLGENRGRWDAGFHSPLLIPSQEIKPASWTRPEELCWLFKLCPTG